MRISLLCIFFCLLSLTSYGLPAQNNLELVSETDVPPNVRNCFNRIYIDLDPEAWYESVVKPKGEKKSRRYTAKYLNKGREHSVMFDEEGIPVAEYYTLGEKMSVHVTKQLAYDFPEYKVLRVESLWVYTESLSVFKVSMTKKSKQEVVFVDDDGVQLFNDVLKQEFALEI